MSSSNTQFSIAVHMLVGMAKYGKVSSAVLATTVNASPIFLKRILAKLSNAGLIRALSGRYGGCMLARQPEEISLLDVYKAVEAPKAFVIHSYAKNKSCDISSNIQGALGGVLADVQVAQEEVLRSQSILDMLNEVTGKK